jgi:hypothetical protein
MYDIYRVTNLNASGPGSLVEGLTWSGEQTRLIIFDVSGTITLDPTGSQVLISGSRRVEVYGNTAPEGIQIAGHTLAFYNCSDITLRHIAMSHPTVVDGDDASSSDCLKILSADNGTSDNITLHRCSFRGADDEVLSITAGSALHDYQYPNARNVLIRGCIFAYGWTQWQRSGNHNFSALLFECDNMIIDTCLFAHNNRRNPQVTGNDILIRDCVMYNTGSMGLGFKGGTNLSAVRNRFVDGAGTSPATKPIQVVNGAPEEATSIYLSGNTRYRLTGLLPNAVPESATDWDQFENNQPTVSPETRLTENPIEDPFTSPDPNLWPHMIGTMFQDAWDRQVISEVLTGTGDWRLNEDELGGIPVYGTRARSLQLPYLSGDKLVRWLEDYKP